MNFMNGLPITIDLSPLIGRLLSQVCFGEFQFILNFDADVRIAVESKCVYDSPSGTFEIENYLDESSRLCKLIGNQVISAKRDVEGGLLLRFANESGLRILNSNPEYESFQVHIKQNTYVA